jgi:hypothetical protein
VKVKWWQYIVMGSAVLFIHPFIILNQFVNHKCGYKALLHALIHSFIVPLFVFALFDKTWFSGFLLGFWLWEYIHDVMYSTYSLVHHQKVGPIIDQVLDQLDAEVKGEGDPETFKNTIYDIAEQLYGKRPELDSVTVEETDEGLTANVLFIALNNNEMPRETAIKITVELNRRKYESHGDVQPPA